MIGFETPQQLMITSGVCVVISLIAGIAGERGRRRSDEILAALDGATAPPLARPVPACSRTRDRTLERMLELGLIGEPMPGRFYKVEPAWQALNGRMRRRGAVGVVALVAIPLVMMWVMQ